MKTFRIKIYFDITIYNTKGNKNKIYSFALYNYSIFYIRPGYHNSVRKYITNIMNEFL